MPQLPYRTLTTWLSDDDLLLLDAMFDCGVRFGHLRRDNYQLQWNLPYTHNYDDHQLQGRLDYLCQRQILQQQRAEGHTYFRFTVQGGDLWSQERCPDWQRYCSDRYKETLRNRTMISVVSVSASTRDDYLHLWPTHSSQISYDHPIRRRKFTVRNGTLISWLPATLLHVGVATFVEVRQWKSGEEALTASKQEREAWQEMERQRTWWREISELQRFVPSQA